MSQFIITARGDMSLGDGRRIAKGDSFEIYIARDGINALNLFGNPASKAEIAKQLSFKGINVPINSPVLIQGRWDIIKR